jgi:hypothetical protein
MTIYITEAKPSGIKLTFVMRGNGIVGDAMWDITPGETVFGRPFEWWLTAKSPVDVNQSGLAEEAPEQD